MIESINLNKQFSNGVSAVNNVNFTVKSGEIFCIYGANGAGKTTTMNMFLNFIIPTSGQVKVDGIDITKNPLKAKEKIAFLSENVQLYGNFSAVQNALFFSQLSPQRKVTEKEVVTALLRCGLDKKFHYKRLASFSKGMRQKVGLAICILQNAKALFLDEPLSGLDPSAVSDMLLTIRALSDGGAAILMSTHDLLRTKEIADTVAIMKSGSFLVHMDQNELKKQDLYQLYMESISNEYA